MTSELKPTAINGYFYKQKMTGVQRVAHQIVLALDKIAEQGAFELVVPVSAKVPGLENIEVVRCGDGNLFKWEQVDLRGYLKKNGRGCVSLCQTAPLGHCDYFAIYDCAYVAHRDLFDGLRGWLSCEYHTLMFRRAARQARVIFTDSEDARGEIHSVLGVPEERIVVIGCGWEHLRAVEASDDALDRYGLVPGGYCFALGGGKNKNLEWVYRVAAGNPGLTFAIAGKRAISNAAVYGEQANVRQLGYVADEDVKALMSRCKAFLFPSTYEGFGIPPLEALACGATIIVSDIHVLRETYGDAAIYVDPHRYDYNIDELAGRPCSGREVVLERTTWDRSAKRLLEAIENGVSE